MTTRHGIGWVLTALALLAGATSARAGGVVGTGTKASCTPGAFAQALAGGGMVTFDCGPEPHTIVVAQRHTITADTTIDGEGRIGLSGGGVRGVFTVQAGRRLTLDRLTIADGGVENWALYVSDDATLNLTNVVVQACSRGGVYNAGGTVTAIDTTFAGNDASAAGAAITNENGGQLTVMRSVFQGNLNGAIYSGGPATIAESYFGGNRGDSAGGAAINHSDRVDLKACRFEDNDASGGGAIYTSGDLLVEDSYFRRNDATAFDGGAILLFNQTQSPSSVTVRRSTFWENGAARAGGAVRCDAPNGICTFENVTFSRNVSLQNGSAAELSLKSGTVQATHVTVLADTAPAIDRIAGTLTMQNSIVDGTCTGGIVDGGGNLQADPGACAPGFQNGHPALFALQENGGITPTHEIHEGSAALGIVAAGCLATDQRGVARPTTGCDAGAFQFGAIPTLTTLTPDRTQAGGPAFALVVRGTSFLAGPSPTLVYWNGTALPAMVRSATELVVSVPATLIATPGVATITIENPNPPVPDGGPAATSLPFTIVELMPPPPPPPGPDPTPEPEPEGPCDGLTSYAAVLCALEQAKAPGRFCAAADLDPKLAKAMQTALGKAVTFVTSGRDATAKRRPKFLRKAKAQLDKLARRAASKRAGKTAPACKTAVAGGVTPLAADVAGLGQ